MGTTLEWIDSAKLLGLAAAEGWPQTLTPHKAACLQTWHKGMERRAHRLETNAWRQLIDLAVATGEIEHTSTTQLVQDDDSLFRPIPLTGAPLARRMDGFHFADGKVRYRTEPRAVTHHHITAHAFSAWLVLQGKEPSPHIAVWFKATGVASPAAPTMESLDQRNARWLAVMDEEKRTGPERGAQARAIRRIVASEGVTEGAAKKAIQTAEQARAERYREGGVTPLRPRTAVGNSVFNQVAPKGRSTR